MSNIDNILGGLDKVKSLGGGRYVALCPVHSEKTPSLSIRELDDDRVICHCFGCGANGVEVVSALGLELDDLFPYKPPKNDYRRERKPFPATQILECMYHEAIVVYESSKKIIKEGKLSAVDNQRVKLANERLYEAITYGKEE